MATICTHTAVFCFCYTYITNLRLLAPVPSSWEIKLFVVLCICFLSLLSQVTTGSVAMHIYYPVVLEVAVWSQCPGVKSRDPQSWCSCPSLWENLFFHLFQLLEKRPSVCLSVGLLPSLSKPAKTSQVLLGCFTPTWVFYRHQDNLSISWSGHLISNFNFISA
jgi:hypothetical protein